MQLVAAAICRADGEVMVRRYNGRTYTARGAYSNREEADGYANSFRGEGLLARVTQERKPRRMRTAQRYMWVVWAGPDEVDAQEAEAACL